MQKGRRDPLDCNARLSPKRRTKVPRMKEIQILATKADMVSLPGMKPEGSQNTHCALF